MTKAIGFTGTQNGMTPRQSQRLFVLISNRVARVDPPEAHHGDCIGADAEFDLLCRTLKCKMVLHPPLNSSKQAFCAKEGDKVFAPLDYLERNRAIVNDCDVLYAAPAGYEEEFRSGTWATIRHASRVGREMVIVWPDGKCTFVEKNAKDYDTLPQFVHTPFSDDVGENEMELEQ
jgi:hypothetical protein